jgi:DsbC/DsbD-like thiol-disulfide interchange protein
MRSLNANIPLCLVFTATAFCQTPLPLRNVVKLGPVETVTAKAGGTAKVALSILVDQGFHVNSDKPTDKYLIPLRLTWSPGALESKDVAFPKPETAKLPFSEKPVSIFSGSFQIVTQFKVPRDAPPGPATVIGKLRYQACNDHECLTPRTLDVSIPVEISK